RRGPGLCRSPRRSDHRRFRRHDQRGESVARRPHPAARGELAEAPAELPRPGDDRRDGERRGRRLVVRPRGPGGAAGADRAARRERNVARPAGCRCAQAPRGHRHDDHGDARAAIRRVHPGGHPQVDARSTRRKARARRKVTMADAKQPDLLIKNVRVVRPGESAPREADIAVRDGKFARISPNLGADAKTVYDGKGRLAFPGVVDAHMHTGIYAPLAEDAVSESRAAAQGGVTSSLNYFRSGQYYLNKGGPYRTFFPEVLKLSAGRFHVDYGYHQAPMDARHGSEMDFLIRNHGVASFKIFMFYGSHGLHGRSDDQRGFLMIGPKERYDLAHFEAIMRSLQRARERLPDKAAQLSLSLHCETPEIMTAYSARVEKDRKLKGLAAYSAARPPHPEGLAVFMAS